MDTVRRVIRAGIRARYAAVALATAACAPAFAACPLEVIGTWRLVNPDEPQPMLVTFGADGWANVVSVTGAGRPEDFDTLAHAWAAAHRSADSTLFFVTMTTIGGPLGLAILGVIVAAILAIKRRWRWMIYLAITCGGGALLNLELKRYFERARPALVEALRQAHGYSFPSGHE